MSLNTCSWSGVVIANEANAKREGLNRRFEMLNFQQVISVQR